MDKKGDTHENEVQWYVMCLVLERKVQLELNLFPSCDQTLNTEELLKLGHTNPKDGQQGPILWHPSSC